MDLEANKHTVSGGPSYQGEYFKFGYDSMMKPAISVIFTGKSPFCNRWVSLKINHSTMFPIFNQDRQLAHFQTHQVEQHSKPYVFPFWSWLVFTGAIPSGFAAATWDGSPVSGTPPAGVAGSSPKKSSFLFLAAAESTSTGPGFLLDTLTLATTSSAEAKIKGLATTSLVRMVHPRSGRWPSRRAKIRRNSTACIWLKRPLQLSGWKNRPIVDGIYSFRSAWKFLLGLSLGFRKLHQYDKSLSAQGWPAASLSLAFELPRLISSSWYCREPPGSTSRSSTNSCRFSEDQFAINPRWIVRPIKSHLLSAVGWQACYHLQSALSGCLYIRIMIVPDM